MLFRIWMNSQYIRKQNKHTCFILLIIYFTTVHLVGQAYLNLIPVQVPSAFLQLWLKLTSTQSTSSGSNEIHLCVAATSLILPKEVPLGPLQTSLKTAKTETLRLPLPHLLCHGSLIRIGVCSFIFLRTFLVKLSDFCL